MALLIPAYYVLLGSVEFVLNQPAIVSSRVSSMGELARSRIRHIKPLYSDYVLNIVLGWI